MKVPRCVMLIVTLTMLLVGSGMLNATASANSDPSDCAAPEDGTMTELFNRTTVSVNSPDGQLCDPFTFSIVRFSYDTDGQQYPMTVADKTVVTIPENGTAGTATVSDGCGRFVAYLGPGPDIGSKMTAPDPDELLLSLLLIDPSGTNPPSTVSDDPAKCATPVPPTPTPPAPTPTPEEPTPQPAAPATPSTVRFSQDCQNHTFASIDNRAAGTQNTTARGYASHRKVKTRSVASGQQAKLRWWNLKTGSDVWLYLTNGQKLHYTVKHIACDAHSGL